MLLQNFSLLKVEILDKKETTKIKGGSTNSLIIEDMTIA